MSNSKSILRLPKRNLLQRLVCPRQYWEGRAKSLRDKGGWFVGRTDMYSYLAIDGGYVHYAYPPNNGERVQFRGSPVSALRRAVRYAERANAAVSGQAVAGTLDRPCSTQHGGSNDE